MLSEPSRLQFFGAHTFRELPNVKYEIAAPSKGKKGAPRSVTVVGFAAAGVASDAIFDKRVGVGVAAPGLMATLWISSLRMVGHHHRGVPHTTATGYIFKWIKREALQPKLTARLSWISRPSGPPTPWGRPRSASRCGS